MPLNNINVDVQDVIVKNIERNVEEPFFVANVQDIIDKHREWLLRMPRIKPFYAVKCNNQPIMLEVLAGLGVGFDCASKAEIESALATGVHPNNIIYANPCKSKNFIQYAERVGVRMMTFDNVFELQKIAKLYPSAQMILRLKVDDSHAVCHLGLKFGANHDEVTFLLQTAKELGLDVIGVSFHVGSGCSSADAFANAVVDAKYAFDVGKTLGFDMTLLDIGGGFPGAPNTEVSFSEIAHVVNEALDIHFPENPADGKNITIIAEPGRYYAASAFTLCTQIIAKRVKSLPNGHTEIHYFINDGVYGSFTSIFAEHKEFHPIPFLSGEQMQERHPYISTIWGPTCDSFDLIKSNAILPEMDVGEWVVFKDSGDYSISVATNFNGFEPAAVKYAISSATLDILKHLPAWPRIANLLEHGSRRRGSISCAAYAGKSWENVSAKMHVH